MDQDSDPQPGQGSGVEADAPHCQGADSGQMTTLPPLPNLNEPLPMEEDSDGEAEENSSLAPNESTDFEGNVRPRLLVAGHGSSSVLGTGNDASWFSTEKARNLRLAASAGTHVFPNPHYRNSSGPSSRNILPSYRSAFVPGSSSSGLNLAEEFRLAVRKIASPVILVPVDRRDPLPERQTSNQRGHSSPVAHAGGLQVRSNHCCEKFLLVICNRCDATRWSRCWELPERQPLQTENDEPLDDELDDPMSEEEILSGIVVHTLEPEKCCICLMDHVRGEQIGTLRCFHRFHVDCIKAWLRCKNICPKCKCIAVI